MLIVTKSDLVLSDADYLRIGSSSVAITVTTLNDEIVRKIELELRLL